MLDAFTISVATVKNKVSVSVAKEVLTRATKRNCSSPVTEETQDSSERAG